MEERRGRTGARGWLLLLGFISVDCIDIRMDSEVYGVVGESAKLWCGFSSSDATSELVTVDWSYRPLAGGATVTIMHYQSKPYPTLGGPFKDRVKWEGNIGHGDASILLEDLKLTDNGTFTCVVRNPPDVHGKVPQTKLTVTLQSVTFKFNTVILLSSLVFIPSALVFIILLIRMKKAIKRDRTRSQKLKKSPIEESQDASTEKKPGCLMRMCLHCLDDYDDDYGGDVKSQV
ncbi:myelin protein zero-like protein 3 isoform X2 [Dendropsophus ebraccatus]|uniref:myelin protein zero-like protein 3 isoform X2 n=1 Tax=Dendropsophus ebraccatus TaxID=150705 RepID=UPI003831114D